MDLEPASCLWRSKEEAWGRPDTAVGSIWDDMECRAGEETGESKVKKIFEPNCRSVAFRSEIGYVKKKFMGSVKRVKVKNTDLMKWRSLPFGKAYLYVK